MWVGEIPKHTAAFLVCGQDAGMVNNHQYLEEPGLPALNFDWDGKSRLGA
jgi:hypothetical protein